MNKQRQVVYALRQSLVKGERVRDTILGMIDDLLESAVVEVCDERIRPHEWDLKKIGERFQFIFNEALDPALFKKPDVQSVYDGVRAKGRELYSNRVTDLNAKLEALDAIFRAQELEDQELENSGEALVEASARTRKADRGFFDFEQHTALETLDQLWNGHLKEMDHLREGIGLRGYGQKNPLYEYQREGFILFQSLMQTMHESSIRKIFFSEPPDPKQLEAQLKAERQRRNALEQQMQMVHESTLEPAADEAEQRGDDTPRNADDQRARLAAQRKARRRAQK